jgi:hypothetical protein
MTMPLPKYDEKTKFDNGGVLYVKMPQSVHLLFYGDSGRVVTDVAIPYYLLATGGKRGLEEMVENAWKSACGMISGKHLSPPNRNTVKDIIKMVKKILDLEE